MLRQYSSGEILLSNSNPHDHPLIDPKSLSHEEDLEDLVEAVKKSRNLFNQSALERFNAGEHAPGSKVELKSITLFLKNKSKIYSKLVTFYQKFHSSKFESKS